MDIFNKIDKTMASLLGKFAEKGHHYFTFPKLEGELGPHMTFMGKEMLTWSLNNYLGLANHPEIRKVDGEAAAKWGLAYPMGSRMLSGNTSLHEEFEDRVSAFIGKESTFLMNFGYQGMASIVQALAGHRDVIVYDQLSHACIIDGCLMSPAKRFVFAHNDMEQFEDRLKKAQRVAEKNGGGILVVTEGVFGMKGDLGKLDEIVAFKEKYNFRLVVDDAHGFGVMGKTGIGTAEHFGVMDKVDLNFSTFAKALAGIGAFVSGDEKVITYLKYNLRSQIYAKSLPMPMVEGGMKRLDMLINMPELRENLWAVVKALQNGLRERGFDIGITESPVTPVYLKGGTAEAARITVDLRSNYGIFLSVVTYPVIEKGKMIYRVIPTASHTLEDVERTLNAFTEIREKMNRGVYQTDELIKTPY